MRSQSMLIFAVVLFAIAISACGGATPPANSNSVSANAPKTNANTNNPLETTKAPAEQTTNDAPTLSPVFKAYCSAIMKKDEAAIRKVYSQETLKAFEKQMKEEKIPTLMKFLENDKIEKICEIRNEKITGDSAVAEIRADWCPNGVKIVFVKENGEWKITNGSPDLDRKSGANSNSAK